MICAIAIDAFHLTVDGLKEPLSDKLLNNVGRAVGLVHQFLARDDACAGIVNKVEESGERGLLPRHAAQHLHGCPLGLHVGKLVAKADARLGLGLVTHFRLQASGKRGVHHVAKWRHVVIGYPPPKPQLAGQENRRVVEHRQYLAYLAVGKVGFVGMNPNGHGRISLALAKGNEHARAHDDARGKRIAHGIGEKVLKGQGQDYVYILHSKENKRQGDTCLYYFKSMITGNQNQ